MSCYVPGQIFKVSVSYNSQFSDTCEYVNVILSKSRAICDIHIHLDHTLVSFVIGHTKVGLVHPNS